MILIIHPRRGFFQITKCQSCGHVFECQNCSSNLVAYKLNTSTFELVCHHCQSYYTYPNTCPECHSTEIFSTKGGVDNLTEILQKELKEKIINLSLTKKTPTTYEKNSIYVTTRIFDPGLKYDEFEKIIIIQSQNLLASPDYLITEEVSKNLGELFLAISNQTEIYLDTSFGSLDFLEKLKQLNFENFQRISLASWYLTFLAQESLNREKYKFYPFVNLLLFTSHQKTKAKSIEVLRNFKKELQTQLENFPEIEMGDIYPARLLKRKNLFSYHLLLKFPRNYDKFPEFQKAVWRIQKVFLVQIRLNPKHLF